jgi:signal transduction histidine kinase/DNA-binding response OmpR family regulator
MKRNNEVPGLSDRLDELRAQSLVVIAAISGGVGYVWLVANIWWVPGREVRLSAWAGSVILSTSVLVSMAMRKRRVRFATSALVWGLLGAAGCAVLAYSFPAVSYIFAVPVIFASVLASGPAHLLIAALACVFTLIVRPGVGVSSWPSSEATPLIAMGAVVHRAVSMDSILPAAIVASTAIGSFLSVRSLNTALAWFLHEYERAFRNEAIALDGQAELRRTLKSLDEATHRLHRANHQLKMARDQAEEARRLKQRFAQAVSHELRTPLNLIVGFSDLMIDSPEYYGTSLPLAYLRDLGIIHRNACQLRALVDDVLDLARIEAAQMSIVPEEITPDVLVQDAVDTVRSLVEARGLVIRMTCEAGLPTLWIDPVRIRQVLINLLNNASRFTARGNITVSVYQNNDMVTFAVEDTGVGIAEEDLSHIFEEFRQVKSDELPDQGGFGLGLAICREFVELHGGRIWAESVVGQGSTFFFSLPLARDRVENALQDSQVEPVHVSGGPDGGDPVVLAVSSNTSAAALLGRYMRRCRTVVVQDIEQARLASSQLSPEVIVLDCSGDDERLKEPTSLIQEWGLQQTIVMACQFEQGTLSDQQISVDGYLTKPVSRQTIWDSLRRFGEEIDRVLVIDDDQDFVFLLGRILENSPVRRYKMIRAYTGYEGLALMQSHQPDLVLVDLMLPDTNGFEVIKGIRSNPAWEHIPVLVVSAQDEAGGFQALAKSIVVARPRGLSPREVVRWVQCAVDMTFMGYRDSPVPLGAHAP